MPPLELSQAVFTQMSMCPKRCTTASPSARTEAGSATSTVSASGLRAWRALGDEAGRLRRLVLVNVGDHGGGAGLGKPQRRRLAHAAAAAGDDGDAAVQ